LFDPLSKISAIPTGWWFYEKRIPYCLLSLPVSFLCANSIKIVPQGATDNLKSKKAKNVKEKAKNGK